MTTITINDIKYEVIRNDKGSSHNSPFLIEVYLPNFKFSIFPFSNSFIFCNTFLLISFNILFTSLVFKSMEYISYETS